MDGPDPWEHGDGGICNECGQTLDAFPFGKAPGMDPWHVMCDICGEHEHPADMTPDWNGETGCHLSCEERSK